MLVRTSLPKVNFLFHQIFPGYAPPGSHSKEGQKSAKRSWDFFEVAKQFGNSSQWELIYYWFYFVFI